MPICRCHQYQTSTRYLMGILTLDYSSRVRIVLVVGSCKTLLHHLSATHKYGGILEQWQHGCDKTQTNFVTDLLLPGYN